MNMQKKKIRSIEPQEYRERDYRRVVNSPLNHQRVVVQETDIHLYSALPADEMAREIVITQRGHIEKYMAQHPGFMQALAPWPEDPFAPPIVQAMIRAGRQAGVGPMAAVAGAVAEQVGCRVLTVSPEVIVENGGDIYLSSRSSLTVAVFAGASPISMKIGIGIESAGAPQAVCTSSGTVGHSLSFGCADAVCVLSSSCPLADAAATAIANRVKSADDIQPSIDWGRRMGDLFGILIIAGPKMGVWGRLKIVPL